MELSVCIYHISFLMGHFFSALRVYAHAHAHTYAHVRTRGKCGQSVPTNTLTLSRRRDAAISLASGFAQTPHGARYDLSYKP